MPISHANALRSRRRSPLLLPRSTSGDIVVRTLQKQEAPSNRFCMLAHLLRALVSSAAASQHPPAFDRGMPSANQKCSCTVRLLPFPAAPFGTASFLAVDVTFKQSPSAALSAPRMVIIHHLHILAFLLIAFFA
ncbi:hypothetical protein M011DRAFT_103154 [Sporormia fimetaria CBS 119925]|uniref:Uncharacterized protein n=1 Tax=Sporormia fimetaria CBS 119925 TaxID=1340428 RepID=A0A6A6VN55_9PLEO|nr:hypothetical protein M011DRAFT_103154 [Sporormia fimetaria CBS 119925]